MPCIHATAAERYNPELDAFPEAMAPSVFQWSRMELRSILTRVRDHAFRLLENDFGGAAHLYPIQNAFAEIISNGEVEPLLATSGSIFTSLDYLFALAIPPRLSVDTKLRLSFFAERRSRDFFLANGMELLAFLGVLRAIPEQWIPSELFKARLRHRLQSMPFLNHVMLETSLYPRMPGGIQWLKYKSLEHFTSLEQDCIAAPAPFVLLLRGLDSTQADIFIANACARNNKEELLLRYCAAKDSSQEMEMALSVPEWGNEFVTIGGERRQVVGLIRARYAPCIPPMSGFQQAMGTLRLRRPLWRLRRSGGRLLRRWRSLRVKTPRPAN